MDTCQLLPTAALTVERPICWHTEDDVFEAIEPVRIDGVRCPACGSAFNFALIEGEGCGAESVLGCAELLGGARTPAPHVCKLPQQGRSP